MKVKLRFLIRKRDGQGRLTIVQDAVKEARNEGRKRKEEQHVHSLGRLSWPSSPHLGLLGDFCC